MEVFKTLLIIPYKRDKIPLLRFSIPVFHHSIIPGWKKKNGRVAILYYQAFLEIPIHLITWCKETIDEWIYFFKNEEIKDEFTARGLKEAKEELDIMKMDEDERREYEEYLEGLRYQASMFESSYKVGEIKGEEKGRQMGRQESYKEIAKKIKEKGTKIELISEITGLPREVIEKL